MESSEDILFGELKKITDPLGVSIVELSAKKGKGGLNIQVVVDKEGGITIDDCEKITRLFNNRLGILEPIEEKNYTLQVSSPGIYRVFKDKREYNIFRSRDVKIVLNEPIDNSGRGTVLKGQLEGLEGNEVTLWVQEKPEKHIRISLEKIKKTQLNG